MTDSDENIGQTLRRLREDRSMTQADVARAMTDAGISGIHPQTILKLESGSRALKFHEGLALARIFGVPAEELTKGPELTRVDRMALSWIRELRERKLLLDQAFTQLLLARGNLERALAHGVSDSIRSEAEAAVAEYGLEDLWRVSKDDAMKSLEFEVPPPDEPLPPPDEYYADYVAQQKIDRERGK